MSRTGKKIHILLDRYEAHVSNQESTRLSLNTVLTRVINPNSNVFLQDESRKEMIVGKENFDRRIRKYYKPGDKVWVTIHPISSNNRAAGNSCPEREGPYLILTLRSPVTYEIADRANPDQALGTYQFLP
ncbi:retrovirus-related Pol polyprotein from transposon 17.6 [Trichonephila clavipes]|nr:retrovirus-related Pol polyprotein from transposon 17.6 [Trichonephila clavipes]